MAREESYIHHEPGQYTAAPVSALPQHTEQEYHRTYLLDSNIMFWTTDNVNTLCFKWTTSIYPSVVYGSQSLKG